MSPSLAQSITNSRMQNLEALIQSAILGKGGASGTSRRQSSTGHHPDRKRNPTLYPSTSNPESGKGQGELAPYELAMKQLQMIADQTGGRMYRPRKIEELSGIYSQIAGDLRIQYQLGYNPSNHAHDGRWREIRVEVKGHPGAVVRTRKGYFAKKDAGGQVGSAAE
jgi:VWFA-related protein